MHKTVIAKQAQLAAVKFRPDLLKKDGELNVARLSRETRVEQATLHRIFKGEIQESKTETLKSVASALRITLDSLISDTELIPRQKSSTHTTALKAAKKEDDEPVDLSTLTESEWDRLINMARPFLSPDGKKRLIRALLDDL